MIDILFAQENTQTERYSLRDHMVRSFLGYLLYWNFNLLELCYDADSVCKNIWGGRPPRAELLDGAKGLRIRDA